GDRARNRARRQAMEAAPKRRALALHLLWEIDLPGDRDFVFERSNADKAESVRKAVCGLLSAADGATDRHTTAHPHATDLLVPELRIDPPAGPPPEARALLRTWLATADAAGNPAGRGFLAIGKEGEPMPICVLVAGVLDCVEAARASLPFEPEK